MKRLTIEETSIAGYLIASQLFKQVEDSRDIGVILSIAASTFLINAPDRICFEEYKEKFLECINELRYNRNSHVS